METKLSAFLEQKITDCRTAQLRLKDENRNDEANFKKIKENVYDIFKTVLAAAFKQCDGDSKKARTFFLEQLSRIPANWQSAYETASLHEDVEKMHIESLKLSAASDIQKAAEALWR